MVYEIRYLDFSSCVVQTKILITNGRRKSSEVETWHLAGKVDLGPFPGHGLSLVLEEGPTYPGSSSGHGLFKFPFQS